jgi:predicted permease
MLNNMNTVVEQVLVLFLLICTGYLCGKLHLLTDENATGLATLCLYIVAPCLLVSSFQRNFDITLFHNFIETFLFALLIHGFTILLTRFTIQDPVLKRQKVLRSTVIFSNCGMVSLALQNALYGADGVFYGAAYIAVFNLIFWTYGIILQGSKEDISLKKILLNPGIIGTVLGLFFFAISYTLPVPIKTASDYIAGLNTPLCMLVIGQQLSRENLKALFSDKGAIWCAVQRLILVPLVVIGAFYLVHPPTQVAVVCVIAACAPAAASNTMLAIKMHQDGALSVNIVSMETVLSMLTMPLIVSLAQTIL